MIGELIDRLIDHNINIELVEEDRLKIHTDINKIPAELLSEIKLRKNDLVRYLAERLSEKADFQRIPNVPLSQDYALSSTQRRLWILGQFQESNVAYNVPRIYVLEGELDQPAISNAFYSLVERHESLRTVFRENEAGEARQLILNAGASGFRMEYHDLSNEKDREAKANELVQQTCVQPFNLSTGPLIRAGLYRVEENKWILTYVMHHIISDGWSMGLVLKELLALYNSYTNGSSSPFAALRVQYKDYAAWQQQQLSGTTLSEHKKYWSDQFEGELPVLALPGGKIRPDVKTYNGTSAQKIIGAEVYRGIKSFTLEQGCTLFMGMLAAVNALFYKYTGQDDIIIGTPVAGREHIDLEDQIGFYANTLALRARFGGDNSYKELLQNIRQVTLGAYEHQVYPFDELVDDLHVQRDPSRNPLFDVQVIVQNAEVGAAPQHSPGKLSVKPYEGNEREGSVFDMVLHFVETGENLLLNILYNTDVYSKDAIERLANHLEQLMSSIVADPSASIDTLELLSAQDKEQLLHAFNDHARAFPAKTIIELFEEQVARTPDNTAVLFGNKTLTYSQLSERSNRLASYLKTAYGVCANQLVGVMLDRSEQMLVAILGILKAGGVYVPVDPQYPRTRKEFIIKDTAVTVLITQAEYLFELDYYQGNMFAIDLQLDTLDAADNFAAVVHPGDLAYVIYTSGSTGQPKGVIIGHSALSNAVQAQQPIFDIQEGERSLQFTSPSFDVSVFEIFITLSSGGALYIIEEELKKDPATLEQYISGNGIAIASIPPAYLRLLDMDKIRSLKKLITGGEVVSIDKVVSFCESGTYFNAYGPTESSLCASVYRVERGDEVSLNIPIGKPIANVELYITANNNMLVPVGVTGELCIGGAGLAKGYLNRAELTAEKFVANPFREGERMYKTGDLGRWLPDGNIEFMGRKDDQVKIRGHRIELGEIENALQGHSAVDEAVVISKQNKDGENELIVYMVNNEPVNTGDLVAYLEKLLPVYMLPHRYVELDEMPLTPNGKTDRKRLPDPQGAAMQTGAEYVAPRNETEEKLVKIWEDILGRENIGIKDDYFELGGSSLKAMVVVKRVLDETGFSVPLKTIFELKSIENISKYIAQTNPGTNIPVTVNKLNGNEDLVDPSYNQLVYFSDWNAHTDQVTVTPFEYTYIDLHAFEQAIAQLIERHEVLRTVFVNADGKIKQRVLPASSLKFVIKSPVSINSPDEIGGCIEKEYSRQFDLSVFPLFDIQILKPGTGNYTMLLTMHHIITDGYSGGVLKNDLTVLYSEILEKKTPALKPLPFQYKDFSNWQRQFVSSAEGEKHKAYWLKRLNGFNTAIKFIAAEQVPQDREGLVIGNTSTIDGKLYKKLQRFSTKNGLTLTVVLMGSLKLLLRKLSGQNDITLFTTVSGRNSRHYGDMDVTGLVGFFSNLLLVRNVIATKQPAVEYLREVQDNFLEDLSYDAYPFEKLITELPGLSIPSLSSRVIFNYHNYGHLKEAVYKGVGEMKEETKRTNERVQFSFSLAVTEFSNCLRLKFIFNGSTFDSERRIEIQEMYFDILKQVIANSKIAASVNQ